MATGDRDAPERHEAGRAGGTNPRDTGQEGERARNRSRLGGSGRMRLPAEFADFILEDGRRLEDVLGKSFFKGFDGHGPLGRGRRRGDRSQLSARERVLDERRAQARRLNQTRAILTGAQGVTGAANIDKSELSGG